MKRAAIACAAAMLAPVATASAHVHVTPARAPAASDARLTFEVENERPTAATTQISLQMPSGVTSVKGLSLRGWNLKTRSAGGDVRRVTLGAPGNRVLTGSQKGRFRMQVGLPRREGATLTFKVLQIYDDGETVRWIGPPGTSEPAPQLKLTAARAPEPKPAQSEPGATGATGAQASAKDDGGSNGGDDGGPPIWAGIGLIVLAGLAGTGLARRRSRRRFRDMND